MALAVPSKIRIVGAGGFVCACATAGTAATSVARHISSNRPAIGSPLCRSLSAGRADRDPQIPVRRGKRGIGFGGRAAESDQRRLLDIAAGGIERGLGDRLL